MTRYTLEIDEDGLLILNEEVLAATGWKEGDELVWEAHEDGTFTLTKVKETE